MNYVSVKSHKDIKEKEHKSHALAPLALDSYPFHAVTIYIYAVPASRTCLNIIG